MSSRGVERHGPRRDDEVLVSDRARERATAALRASFERGRFDAEELERRTAGVLAARTRADLRAVTRDLPHRPRRRRRPVPMWQWPAMPLILLGRAARRRRRRRRR